LVEAVEKACSGGVDMVQLRLKNVPASDFYQSAKEIKAVLPEDIPFLINDRVDIAVAVGADGVHLPELGLPVSLVREQMGEDAIVGRSVHSVEAALQAYREGVDYLQVGTIFPTGCKPGHKGSGVVLLEEIRNVVGEMPIIAIGGISEENAVMTVQAGANGVAVVSRILQADDPSLAARHLKNRLTVSE